MSAYPQSSEASAQAKVSTVFLIRLQEKKYFYLALIGLSLLYLASVLFLNSYTLFSADEFWFTHKIYQYRQALPYRDFAPYKSVLGYYLLLPPLLLANDVIGALSILKNSLALLNTFIFFSASLILSRYFNRLAILGSLFILIVSENVLSYSTNVRVDLLAYWCCLFALLSLLGKKPLIAGFLSGFAFIISQKAIWCLMASNMALFAIWLLHTRDKKNFLDLIKFNLSNGLIILSYILFWSQYAKLKTILDSLFFEASLMYRLDWYAEARKLFWQEILSYNAFLFLCLPFMLLSFIVGLEKDEHYWQRLFVFIYTSTLILFLIPYKQIFPYYIQVLYPALFVTYSALFSWFYEASQSTIIIVKNKLVLQCYTLCHLLLMTFIIINFNLPSAYFLILALPLFLYYYFIYFNQATLKDLCLKLILIASLFLSIIYPGLLTTMKTLNLDGQYQKANIALLNHLLTEGGDYLAGVELLYNRNQPIAGMRHLNGPAIDFLSHPNQTLKEAMLASLDLDKEANIQTVLSDLESKPIKLYVNNYRIHHLPTVIKNYLAKEFEHYWGSIYLYSPTIPAGEKLFKLKFSGYYLMKTHVKLNKKAYLANSIIYLNQGFYYSEAKQYYRLKYLPAKNYLLNKNFNQDQWGEIIF